MSSPNYFLMKKAGSQRKVQAPAGYAPEPWYRWHRFALVPTWSYRAEDEYNTSKFHFHWLVFRLWTMDSPDISFEVTLDDQQLQVRGRLPYVIFGVFVPLFPMRWSQKLWRKSPASKRLEKMIREERKHS